MVGAFSGGMVVLAACGTSAGDGTAGGSAAPGSGSARVSSAAPTPARTPTSPTDGSPSPSATAPSTSAGRCAADHAEVTVTPDDAVDRHLCVRPGTVVSLVLRPRTDDRRWTAVHSSAPVVAPVSGWRLDADGTGHASLRCAGPRGTAEITALAKAPDVAGAARGAFTLHVSVVPYPTQE